MRRLQRVEIDAEQPVVAGAGKAVLDHQQLGVGERQHTVRTRQDLPLPSASVDVVISNGVVNLAPDKLRVFREIARVLRVSRR